jgi:hypothetical protein
MTRWGWGTELAGHHPGFLAKLFHVEQLPGFAKMFHVEQLPAFAESTGYEIVPRGTIASFAESTGYVLRNAGRRLNSL